LTNSTNLLLAIPRISRKKLVGEVLVGVFPELPVDDFEDLRRRDLQRLWPRSLESHLEGALIILRPK